MTKFRLKVSEFEAWQFCGFDKIGNSGKFFEIPDAPDWLVAAILIDMVHPSGDNLHVRDELGCDVCAPGDWILFDKEAGVTWISAKDFKEFFEPVKPEKVNIDGKA